MKASDTVAVGAPATAPSTRTAHEDGDGDIPPRGTRAAAITEADIYQRFDTERNELIDNDGEHFETAFEADLEDWDDNDHAFLDDSYLDDEFYEGSLGYVNDGDDAEWDDAGDAAMNP